VKSTPVGLEPYAITDENNPTSERMVISDPLRHSFIGNKI